METITAEFLVKVTRKSGHENFFLVNSPTSVGAIVEVIGIFSDPVKTPFPPDIVEIKVAQIGVNTDNWKVRFPITPI